MEEQVNLFGTAKTAVETSDLASDFRPDNPLSEGETAPKGWESAEPGPEQTPTAPTPPPEAPKANRKWTSTAGPRQTKLVNQALSAIQSEGRSYTELSGVTGVDEHTHSFMVLFGGMREDCAAALVQLAERFDYTVTRENHQAIITAAAESVKALVAARPVKDTRRSPQADQEQTQKYEQAKAEREEQEQRRESRIQAKGYAIAGQFPWKQRRKDGESNHAWTGRNVRAELERTYPYTRFKVGSDYSSIRVEWEMGPTYKAIEALLKKYQEVASPENSSQEERENAYIEGKARASLIGSVRYLSISRQTPPALLTEIAKWICKVQQKEFTTLQAYGILEEGGSDTLSDYAWRLYGQTHFPEGAKIVGIDPAPVENTDPQCLWVLRLDVTMPPAAPAGTAPTTSASGVIVRYSSQHQGVEIKFPSKPAREVIDGVKAAGFRWSMRSGVWYRKYSEAAWSSAHRLAGIETPKAPTAANEPDRFDMAVEDRMAEQCGL